MTSDELAAWATVAAVPVALAGPFAFESLKKLADLHAFGHLSDTELSAARAQVQVPAETVQRLTHLDALKSSQQPRRTRYVLAMSVSIIVAIGVGLVVLGSAQSRHTGGTPGPVLGASTASAQKGFKAITYHGLALDIPRAWPVTTPSCTPRSNSVTLSDSALTCALVYVRGVTVTFSNGDALMADTSGARAKTTIGGYSATTLKERVAEFQVRQISIRRLAVTLTTTASAGANASDIWKSLRVVGVDANGCASQVTKQRSLTARTGSPNTDRANALIPGKPQSIRVCRYLGGFIEQSSLISDAHLPEFLRALNSAPVGSSVARPEENASNSSSCRRSATSVGATSGPSVGDSEFYIIDAIYGNASNVTVTVRLGSCGDLGATNGERTVQRSAELVNAIVDAAGAAQGYPTHVQVSK